MRVAFPSLALFLVSCAETDDVDPEGSDEPAEEAGPTYDPGLGGEPGFGGDAEPSSACEFGIEPWTVAVAEDAWAALGLSTPAYGLTAYLTVQTVDWLEATAEGGGLELADLPCVSVEESASTVVVDAGTGCEFSEELYGTRVFVSGRFIFTNDGTMQQWIYEDFVFETATVDDPSLWSSFRLDGDVWMEFDAGVSSGGSALALAYDGSMGWYNDLVALDLYQELELRNEASVDQITAYVEVVDAPKGAPEGAFCLEYDTLASDVCDGGRDGFLRVEGDAVGQLSYDESKSCDDCYPFTLDGVAGEPYCR